MVLTTFYNTLHAPPKKNYTTSYKIIAQINLKRSLSNSPEGNSDALLPSLPWLSFLSFFFSHSMNHTSHLGFLVLNTAYPIVIPSNNQHPYPINTTFQPNPLANEESWSSWNTDGSGGGSISSSVLHLIDNGNPHNSKFPSYELFSKVPNCFS